MDQVQAITPFQARLNLLAFLGVAGVIATNALYFQNTVFSSKADAQIHKQERQQRHKAKVKPKPAPLVKKEKAKVDETTTQSITETETAHSEDSTAERLLVIETETSEETVKAVQRELKARGYAPGAQDGAAGMMTRAAVLAFEFDTGQPLTATPNDRILEMMIFGVPNSVKASGSRKSVTPVSRKIVKIIQKELNDLGYSAGELNGVMGIATRQAIKEFETDRKLRITGRVSGRLIRELIKFTDIPTGQVMTTGSR